jgi:hypothetical protein
MDQDYNQNFVIMETMKQISVDVQEWFRKPQIPANVITHSLLTRVEIQYQVYRKTMTIQLAAETNDIFKLILVDSEDALNNLLKVTGNIDAAAERVNNAKNSAVGKMNVEIAKASEDNDDHVDEGVQDATNSIINEITGKTGILMMDCKSFSQV